MPSRVAAAEDGVKCSYFSICDMDDVVAVSEAVSDRAPGSGFNNPSYIVNLHVNSASLTKYQSLTNDEQHFHPSSLIFELLCLFESGHIKVSHLGLQKKVLHELQTRGVTELVAPDKLFQLCSIAQLTTHGHPLPDLAENGSQSQQRSALLTVALEHHMVSFLTECVSHWFDGKYSDADCTVRFLLDWAWKSVADIKQTVDVVTVPLFDWSVSQVSDSIRRTLTQSCQQLKHLHVMISEIISQEKIQEEQRVIYTQVHSQKIKELKLKAHLAKLIRTYVEVLVWFSDAGLLPELPPAPEEDQEDNADYPINPFPVAAMVSNYNDIRQAIRQKLLELNFEEGGQDGGGGLMVDQICADLNGAVVKANFERDGGNGHYPPPTLRSGHKLNFILNSA